MWNAIRRYNFCIAADVVAPPHTLKLIEIATAMPESPRPEQRIETPRIESSGELPRPAAPSKPPPKEIGGRGGLEPTRYGDWEKDGRCIDF